LRHNCQGLEWVGLYFAVLKHEASFYGDYLPGTSEKLKIKSGESKMIKQLWMDEEGLTTVEYALLLALVAIAAIAAWTTLGSRTSATVTKATNTGMPSS